MFADYLHAFVIIVIKHWFISQDKKFSRQRQRMYITCMFTLSN